MRNPLSTDGDTSAQKSPAPVPVIVLAGERPGGSALAAHFQAASSVLVPLAGASPLAWTLRALRATTCVESGWLLASEALQTHLATEGGELTEAVHALQLKLLQPATGPAASAAAALARSDDRPMLLTAADHALLRSNTVEQFIDRGRKVAADLIVGLVPYEPVAAAFPGSKRTRLRFREGDYCGSNLFLINSHRGDLAIAAWARFEALRKQPFRLAARLGFGTLARYLAGQLTRKSAAERFTALTGARVAFVDIEDPRAAVDVDSVTDWALADRLLSAEA